MLEQFSESLLFKKKGWLWPEHRLASAEQCSRGSSLLVAEVKALCKMSVSTLQKPCILVHESPAHSVIGSVVYP